MNKNVITNIILACGLVLAIPAGISMGESISKPIKIKEKAIEAVESGYTVYIDGVEVPSNQIDLSLYNKFSIDDDNKIVFIAR